MLDTTSSPTRDATSTAADYLSEAANQIERQYPEASHDARCTAAANLALAMAIQYLAIVAGGQAADSPLSQVLTDLVEKNESRY